MRVLIIDNTEVEDSGFNEPLESFVADIVGDDYDMLNFRELPEPALIETAYDAYVLSGVPRHYSFDSIDERLPYFQWIPDSRLVGVGICMGHEVIARLFGGEIVVQRMHESGGTMHHVMLDDTLFSGIPAAFPAHMMHRAAATLPESFIILSSTADCDNAIMRHHDKHIYGVQSHPELSGVYGRQLFENFFALADRSSMVTPEDQVA